MIVPTNSIVSSLSLSLAEERTIVTVQSPVDDILSDRTEDLLLTDIVKDTVEMECPVVDLVIDYTCRCRSMDIDRLGTSDRLLLAVFEEDKLDGLVQARSYPRRSCSSAVFERTPSLCWLSVAACSN